MPDAGKLAGRNVSELILWMESSDVTTCAVGLTTLNALITAPASAASVQVQLEVRVNFKLPPPNIFPNCHLRA
jgi:hypothetical protein